LVYHGTIVLSGSSSVKADHISRKREGWAGAGQDPLHLARHVMV
jgi:hypothetical protein